MFDSVFISLLVNRAFDMCYLFSVGSKLNLRFLLSLCHLHILFPGCHATFICCIQKRAQEPCAAVPPTTGCADYCVCPVESDAKHLPQRGDGSGQ